MTEDEIYQKIYDEISVDKLIGSTWIKSYELANGDDKLAKVKYISLRYEEIKKESVNNDLISEQVKNELSLLNKIRYQAGRDNALNSLSSLRYWYINSYSGDVFLSDAQLEKVIELSRSSELKRPAVPEKYRGNSKSTTDGKRENLSSNQTHAFKTDTPSKLIKEEHTEAESKKGKLHFMSWIIPCIVGYLLVKLFGFIPGAIAISCYVLIVDKTGIFIAAIISLIAAFISSIIFTLILL